MTNNQVDQRTVRAAVELASRAPSVHNSQPWRWVLGDRSVHLYTDLRRWLPNTDAEGRDLVVSCGAALHHLRIALAAAGIGTRVHRFPDPNRMDHLAAVEFQPNAQAEADVQLAAAIPRRRTDRRRYADWEVPPAFVEELIARAADQGALLRRVITTHARTLLLAAIHEAARLQDQDPGRGTETAVWSGLHASADGIPAANLLRDPVGTGAGTARRFSEGTLDQPPTGDDGALLLVLGTASDDRLSQLRAGEALSAVLLHATELGLATCPLSEPLEVGTSRLTLRDEVLDGTMSPQLVLRVGWAPAGERVPATPRRPVTETIEQLLR